MRATSAGDVAGPAPGRPLGAGRSRRPVRGRLSRSAVAASGADGPAADAGRRGHFGAGAADLRQRWRPPGLPRPAGRPRSGCGRPRPGPANSSAVSAVSRALPRSYSTMTPAGESARAMASLIASNEVPRPPSPVPPHRDDRGVRRHLGRDLGARPRPAGPSATPGPARPGARSLAGRLREGPQDQRGGRGARVRVPGDCAHPGRRPVPCARLSGTVAAAPPSAASAAARSSAAPSPP